MQLLFRLTHWSIVGSRRDSFTRREGFLSLTDVTVATRFCHRSEEHVMSWSPSCDGWSVKWPAKQEAHWSSEPLEELEELQLHSVIHAESPDLHQDPSPTHHNSSETWSQSSLSGSSTLKPHFVESDVCVFAQTSEEKHMNDAKLTICLTLTPQFFPTVVFSCFDTARMIEPRGSNEGAQLSITTYQRLRQHQIIKTIWLESRTIVCMKNNFNSSQFLYVNNSHQKSSHDL